jgi:hypothetical protein
MKGCPSRQLFDIHVRGKNINPIKNDQDRDLEK